MGRSGTGSTLTGAAVARTAAGWVRTSGPSWFGCAGRTPSCGCGVTCSSAAWPSGFRTRWRAPDLVCRRFGAGRPNQKWFGDGTEVATGEGKLHLASVLDIFSRRVVGFALSEHHDAELAYGALAMAVAVRGGQVTGVIMHTDQGSEYTGQLFRQACRRLGIRQSMGRPGSALDNAAIEAGHSTLEFELRARESFATKATARTRVAAWIDEYNRERRHSALGMQSPIAYELAHARTEAA